MNYRCIILTLIFNLTIAFTPAENKFTTTNIIKIEKPKTRIEKILDIHTQFATKLYRDSIITIEPEQFAKMLLVMNWCESGLDTSATSRDGYDSHGIYQFTEKTRKYLNIPKDIRNKTISKQNEYYYRFMSDVGKQKTQQIKTIVDLHAMNYTPTRMFKNILSSRGAIQTRSDLIEFQIKRVKENQEIEKIYQSLKLT